MKKKKPSVFPLSYVLQILARIAPFKIFVLGESEIRIEGIFFFFLRKYFKVKFSQILPPKDLVPVHL